MDVCQITDIGGGVGFAARGDVSLSGAEAARRCSSSDIRRHSRRPGTTVGHSRRPGIFLGLSEYCEYVSSESESVSSESESVSSESIARDLPWPVAAAAVAARQRRCAGSRWCHGRGGLCLTSRRHGCHGRGVTSRRHGCHGRGVVSRQRRLAACGGAADA